MGPSPSVRRFDARLRLYVALNRAVRGFDTDARNSVAALMMVLVGIAIVAGPGWALLVTGLLLSLLSPLGNALRVFVRGK